MAFYHSIILSFYHSIILSFYHSIILSFNHSSNATLFYFVITFTKTDLKIPYFLSFPLALTLLFLLSLTHTAFFNHLIP
nr:hypothetical protein [Helicobacter pylori]